MGSVYYLFNIQIHVLLVVMGVQLVVVCTASSGECTASSGVCTASSGDGCTASSGVCTDSSEVYIHCKKWDVMVTPLWGVK